MIELPFTLTIDFIIEQDKSFSEEVFVKLLSNLCEITPRPILKVYAYNTDFYNKISELLNNKNINTVFNFYFNEKFKNIPNKKNVNLIFSLNTVDLYKKITLHRNQEYNLVLVPAFGVDEVVKSEFERIKNDLTIKNLFLQPYLTENELDKFSQNILCRSFLTCAAAWLNPIINSNGEVYCCKNNKIGSLINENLIDIWNSNSANEFRDKILKKKNLGQCSSCLKKYNDNFLVVDKSELEYKGNKYVFPSMINYVNSAPKVAIIGQKNSEGVYLVDPYPIFSDEDISLLSSQILLLLG